jgi:hypothetical protein
LLLGLDLFVLAIAAVSFAIAWPGADVDDWSDAVFLSLVAANGFAIGLGRLLPETGGGRVPRAASLPLGLLLLVALTVDLALRLAAGIPG